MVTNLVPNDFFLDRTVLVFGVISGAAGGFASARVWNRYPRSRFRNQGVLQPP